MDYLKNFLAGSPWLIGVMLVGAVLAFNPGLTWAQQPEDQEPADTVELSEVIVKGATRFETPLDSLSRAVTVVREAEVEVQKRLDPNLGSILGGTVPGMSPSTEALSDYGQTLRGRPFLTLIDGVPQTMTLRDGRRAVNVIDPDAIEQIEVIRGGTAIYGFGATGGMVNVITKRPESGDPQASLTVGTDFSTRSSDSVGIRASGRLTGGTDTFDYLVNVSHTQRGATFDADGNRRPADTLGAQGGLADTGSYDFFGKIGFDLGDGEQRLELTGNRFSIRQDSEFAGLADGGDRETGARAMAVRGNFNPEDPGSDNLTLNLAYKRDELLGSRLDSQLYYSNLEVTYSKFPGYPQTEIISEKHGARLSIRTPVGPHAIIWGADYLKDKTTQRSTDALDTSPMLDLDAVAGFVQAEAELGTRFFVTAGVRYEDISVDASDFYRDVERTQFVQGGTLTFGETVMNASGTIHLTETVDVFAGFSQGFTVGEIGRSIRDGTFATAKEFESEAQKIDSYEVGIRGDFGNWNGAIVGFYNQSDNGVSFDEELNILKLPEEIHGVELDGNVRIGDRVTAGGTLAWLKGTVDTDDDGTYDEDLPNERIPPLKLTGYVTYQVSDRTLLRLQGLYSGTRDPNSTAFAGTTPIESYLLFDAFASIALWRGELQVAVRNLANADYTPVINQAYDYGTESFAYVGGPGRTWSVTYAMDF